MKGIEMKKVIVILAVLTGILIMLNCGGDDVVNVDHGVKIVLYPVADTSVYYNDTLHFQAYVWNTTDTTVKWYVNGIENGNNVYGNIDSTGRYFAPNPVDSLDEVTVKIVSTADTTKSDSTIVYILNEDFVFINVATGDDIDGIGSRIHPFKTIGKGISVAKNGQIILVAPGTYNVASGESFPLIPTRDVTIQGEVDSTTIVEPSDDQPAFNLQYERATAKNLTIRRATKTGVGIEYGGIDGIIRLLAIDITIKNCSIAAQNTGQADSLEFTSCTVDSCVNGFVVDEEPAVYLNLDQTTFTNIDSIAIKTISPVTERLNLSFVTIDNAWIGLDLSQASHAVIRSSVFANIESTAVYLNASATMGTDNLHGNNDFSGCSNWCIINNTADTVWAQYNTWPTNDTLLIDSQYIYDKDEDPSLGEVIFVPINTSTTVSGSGY